MIHFRSFLSIIVILMVFNDPGNSQISPTLPPGCQATAYSNQYTPNGINAGVLPIQTCLTQCLAYNGCPYGFDYIVATTTCYISTQTFTYNTQAGTTHYQCLYLSSVMPFVSTTLTSSNCNTFASNIASPGGTLQSYSGLAACQAGCQAVISTACANGFDYNPTTSQCWFSTTSTTMTASGINHYTCTGTPTTNNCNSFLANTNSPGGILQPFTGLAACQAACQAAISTTCSMGFDYNPATTQCWFSTSPTRYSTNGIYHYSCSGTSPPSSLCANWNILQNSNTYNGNADSATNLNDCIVHCFLFNGCKLGFDWVAGTSSCYISTTSQLGILSGVSHYSCSTNAVNAASQARIFVSGAILLVMAMIVQFGK